MVYDDETSPSESSPITSDDNPLPPEQRVEVPEEIRDLIIELVKETPTLPDYGIRDLLHDDHHDLTKDYDATRLLRMVRTVLAELKSPTQPSTRRSDP